MEMGRLVPAWHYEVLPGDKWSISSAQLARLAAMLAPQYSDVNVKTFCVFVPYRVLYQSQDDFQNWWMGRSSDNEFGAGDPPPPPYFTYTGGCIPGTIGNYMGIPDDIGPDSINLNPLPLAAYIKAYDDWFRPQLFVEDKLIKIVPGANPAYATLCGFEPERIGWRPDLFTAAAPSPQLGQSVLIPLVNDPVPVTYASGQNAAGKFRKSSDDSFAPGVENQGGNWINSSTDADMRLYDGFNNDSNINVFYDPDGTLETKAADLNGAANTIETLRTAFKMQRYFEALLRVGTRFVDYLRGIWNVESSDARLQNAELLGMKQNPVSISEVVSTADTVVGSDGLPLGSLGGHGISADATGVYEYYAEEPGIILGIVSVVPETYYYQGIDPAFLRETYLDYPIPHLDNIGEEEIPLCELYAATSASNHRTTFGYRPRNSRWKTANNTITGQFQTNLDYFHFGRKFDTVPVLDATFIEANVPQRPFAVQGVDVHHVWMKIVVKAWAKRNLSAFSTPSLNPGS